MNINLYDILFEAQSIPLMDTSKKLIVTAGSPGSGKSTIINKIVGHLDFRSVDADDLLTAALKKEKIPLNFSQQTPEQGYLATNYRDLFRRLTTKSRYLAAKQGRGIIFHTTGAHFDWVKRHIDTLKNEYGYQGKMLYVAVPLEQSLERNRKRERSIPDKVVKRLYGEICQDIKEFISYFGEDNFHYVDNSDSPIETIDSQIKRVERELTNWLPAKQVEIETYCK